MGLHSDTAKDVATVSNFREVEVKHYHLAITVNFEKQEINGCVSLICQALKSSLDKVILDVHETLAVHKVTINDSEDAEFSIEPFTGYGKALHVELAELLAEGSEFAVTIEYTATNGPGVCWLKPAQTAGKVKPYMYTQGQAVCNRSFFPCQDTPAVKCPYSAEITVPEGFTAVMSCCISSCEAITKDDHAVAQYSFTMPHSIQAYLIALAVGDLQSADIGPRSRVWTEPSQLAKAKAEFDGVVEEFISTGEGLFGPYVWDRYDILVMPPSFPYGGMENPCMTFVTPCLLVGDKSLTDVVIHEISHSWFGNLVTNANWSEFWLNEGFTMFAQRRIMEKIFGRAYTCLETKIGLALLKQHMDESGHDHPLNRLRVVIEPGVDPDDTYNETPYEKGYSFVCYLQHLAGSVEEFDDFLKAYVDKYKFKSIIAEDALDFFLEYFPKLKEQGVDKREGFEFHSMWLDTPGWPPFTPDLTAGQELTEPAETLADKWAAEAEQPISDDITAWKTYQVLHFLDSLLAKEKFPDGALSKMEAAYPSISNTHNAEIRLRWSQITVKNRYDEDLPRIRKFLHSQGKQKYTLPLYKALVKGTDAAKKLATDVFTETKEQLHVNVQNYVNKILSRE